MRTYTLISGTLFAVVALAHALRLFQGWSVELAEDGSCRYGFLGLRSWRREYLRFGHFVSLVRYQSNR